MKYTSGNAHGTIVHFIGRVRRKLRDKGGHTLMEAVVTFALTAALITFSTMLISRAAAVSIRIGESAEARGVAALLIEKTAGEISGARSHVAVDSYNLSGESVEGETLTAMILSDGSRGGVAGIALFNRTGSPIYMHVSDGRLVISYRPVNTGLLHLDAVDWRYDDAVYHGYRISRLAFERVEELGVIRISLEIVNETGYTYTAERCVKCYNFVTDGDLDRIKTDIIHPN